MTTVIDSAGVAIASLLISRTTIDDVLGAARWSRKLA
jgi:hypothetical protein